VPVERPTFSESWYRVADLRPRLRFTVQVHRQHFRGRVWYVLEDPGSNQFFRVSPAAYRFVGLLDGRRTVAEAWRTTGEQLGDAAPTQGEAIQLLGQLYTSNLLHGDLPPDAEGLFERYRRRVRREVQGYLMNFLFIRIPLIDPDRILDRWVSIVGRLFTWYGFALWLGLLCVGGYFLAGNVSDLWHQASGILDPGNLPLLYGSLILAKVFHEFSHAFACKKFGRKEGTGGEVHVMGIMFLVFMPLPYMDASSAWAFRKKWHRVIVGCAGMMAELAIAAVAAIVWSRTAEGTTAHALAYNVMFVASVSTVLFNANFLLRFDGYYILSDLLEIPNLYQRSREYLYYLVRRHVWRVRHPRNPAHTVGERIWFVVYGLASTAFRVFISIRIVLFLGKRLPKELFFVAVALGIGAVVGWVLVPLGKFIRYLATNQELARVRPWAVTSSLVVVLAVVGGLGLLPVPDRCRVEGVVEPVHLAEVYMGTDGFLEGHVRSGEHVAGNGPPVVRASNFELSHRRDELLAERSRLERQRRLARARDERAAVEAFAEQIDAIEDQIARLDEHLAALEVRPPLEGTWLAPALDRSEGDYRERGEAVGRVASLDELFIRATAGQNEAAMLLDRAAREVEIRLKGRPGVHLTGRLERILPAGMEQLPSAALGYAAGGAVQTDPEDRRGLRTAERFFEVRIVPHIEELPRGVRLLSGQRVVVRFEMGRRPLVVQWGRALLQVVQRRFHI
jgi:putative peptide zinc metalloprotease protein